MTDKPGRGHPSRLNEAQRAEVGRWLDEGPQDGVPAWTVGSIRDRIKHVFDVVMSGEAVRRLMRALGFRRLLPRPLHPKADPVAQEKFRSDLSAVAIASLPEGTDPAGVDVWFEDEARLGQKGMLTRERQWKPIAPEARAGRQRGTFGPAVTINGDMAIARAGACNAAMTAVKKNQTESAWESPVHLGHRLRDGRPAARQPGRGLTPGMQTGNTERHDGTGAREAGEENPRSGYEWQAEQPVDPRI